MARKRYGEDDILRLIRSGLESVVEAKAFTGLFAGATWTKCLQPKPICYPPTLYNVVPIGQM